VSGDCGGLHCDGCGASSGGSGRGKGGAGLAVAVLVILAIAAAARPIEHALEIAGLVLAGITCAAVAGGLVVAGVRVRRAIVARQRRAVPSAARAWPRAERIHVITSAQVRELPVSQAAPPAELHGRGWDVPARRQR
jgi:hypothetical protein